jgi:hypothetical protein
MTINTDDLTIKQARELAAQFCGAPIAAPPADTSGSANRPVIVRSRDAGVQFGYLDHFEGSTVYLKNARQMWSWTAIKGGTLLDCATHGVSAGKFSTTASAVIVIGACAIIDCTSDAVKTLEAAKWS